MKIAFIIYRENAEFSFGDQEHDNVLGFLRKKGLDIYEVAWDNPGVNWKEYGLVILKSPWDYVEKYEQFMQWLDKLVVLGVPALNPVDVVKWNSDKHYLSDIEKAGLNTLPTEFVEKGASFEAATYFRRFNTSQLIVKPCISGASKNTFKITAGDLSKVTDINALLQHESMMVQPFLHEINSEGEWSLLFFYGKFSHALLKTPTGNDFRSQPQFGANIRGKQPSAKLLASASRFVEQFAEDCLYARVDGLMIDGEFHLMELELIEPYLFLSTTDNGYENYFEALKKMLKEKGIATKVNE